MMPDTTDADSADHVTTTPDMAGDVRYEAYQGEEQLPMIAGIVDKDLSEPYSIYTYRFFLHNWPSLTFLVRTFPSFLLFACGLLIPIPSRRLSMTRSWASSSASWSSAKASAGGTLACWLSTRRSGSAASDRRSCADASSRWRPRDAKKCVQFPVLLSLLSVFYCLLFVMLLICC